MGQARKPPAAERDPGPAGRPALSPHRGLGGRGGHPSEPEDRPGRDGLQAPEGGQDPGQNEKRYLAGVLNVRPGQLLEVEGTKKTGELFVDLLVKRIMPIRRPR